MDGVPKLSLRPRYSLARLAKLTAQSNEQPC